MIEFLIGGGVAYVAGWISGRIMRRKPSGAFCPCGHSIGHHKDQKGPCSAQARRPHYHSGGGRNGYEWVPCGCLHYSGPELLSNVTFRELEDR